MTENTKAAKSTAQITFFFIVIYKASIKVALLQKLSSFIQHFDVFRLICYSSLLI